MVYSPTCYLLFRYVQPRGNPEPGEELQDAEARQLFRGALQHHVFVLEGKPRRQAHLRVPEERSGGLLHCHREAVSGIALMGQRDIKTCNKNTHTKGLVCERGGWIIFFCLFVCLLKSMCLSIEVHIEILQMRVLCFCILKWPLWYNTVTCGTWSTLGSQLGTVWCSWIRSCSPGAYY